MHTQIARFLAIPAPPVWLIKAVLILGMFASLLPVIVEFAKQESAIHEARMAGIELIPMEQLRAEGEALYKRINNEQVASAYEYYLLLEEVNRYEDHWQKVFNHQVKTDRQQPFVAAVNPHGISQAFSDRYLRYMPFSTEELMAGQERYTAEFGALPGAERLTNNDRDFGVVVERLFNGYLWSVLFAGLFMAVRVREEGAKIHLEIDKLLLYAFIWPARIGRYPTYLVSREQWARMRKVLAYACSSFLYFGTFGVVKAASTKKVEENDPITWMIDEGTFELHGFTKWTIGTGEEPILAPVRLNAAYQKGPWRLRTEVELTDVKPDGNWLRELHVSYTLENGWTVRGGRIVTAAAFTWPPPYKDAFVHGFSAPFSAYGWGVQAAGSLSDTLSLTADVTGTTGVAFDSPEAFSSLETSMRLLWRPEEYVTLGLTAQLTEDAQRGGLDVEYRPNEDLRLQTGVFAERTDSGTELGGFGLFERMLGRDWSLHGLVDHVKHQTRAVLGLGWRSGQPGWSAKLDAEYDFKTGDPGVYGQVQFSF